MSSMPRTVQHNRPAVGQALSPANRGLDQALAGESACPTIFHLPDRDGHALLARVASEADHDGLIAGRDIGRDHYVQLHDAGDECGSFPGEAPLGRLTADGDGCLLYTSPS